MPAPIGLLSEHELDSVRSSWTQIDAAGGTTYVDGADYAGGPGQRNAVAEWFQTAARSEQVALYKAQGMVLAYASYAARATQNHEALDVYVWIETETPGTITLGDQVDR